jgi:hypothetical protein
LVYTGVGIGVGLAVAVGSTVARPPVGRDEGLTVGDEQAAIVQARVAARAAAWASEARGRAAAGCGDDMGAGMIAPVFG